MFAKKKILPKKKFYEKMFSQKIFFAEKKILPKKCSPNFAAKQFFAQKHWPSTFKPILWEWRIKDLVQSPKPFQAEHFRPKSC